MAAKGFYVEGELECYVVLLDGPYKFKTAEAAIAKARQSTRWSAETPTPRLPRGRVASFINPFGRRIDFSGWFVPCIFSRCMHGQLDSLFMIDQFSPQEIYWICTIRGIYVEIDGYFWQRLLVNSVSLNQWVDGPSSSGYAFLLFVNALEHRLGRLHHCTRRPPARIE